MKKAVYCANCQTRLTSVVLQGSKANHRYTLYRCSHCELIQLSSRKAVSTNLYAEVSTDAYIKRVNPQLRFIYGVPLGKKLLHWYNNLCYKARFWQVRRFKKSGHLLDIGSGNGQFLHFFGPMWQLSGVEVNRDFVKISQELVPSAKIYAGKFERFKSKPASYDVITLWHVFEHLDNPLTVMKKIYRLLKPGGLLFVEVPQGNSLLRKLFSNDWQLLMFPQHLYFWTAASLRYLAKQTKFTIVSLTYLGFISSGPASTANFLRRARFPSFFATLIGLMTLPMWIGISVVFYSGRDNVLVVLKK